MATGDAAGAAGLKTYGDDLLVKDVDTALNQRGDELAAVMGRTKALETQTIGVPKFSVQRSSNGQNIKENNWTQLTAGAYSSPLKTVGGFTWSGGVLTVPRAGFYAVLARVKMHPDDFTRIGVIVNRNSTSPFNNTITKGMWVGTTDGDDPFVSPTVAAERLLQPLNAGDTLRVFVYHRNANSTTLNLDVRSDDLTFEVLWQDSL